MKDWNQLFMIILISVLTISVLKAQNDGIRGYGSLEFIELDTYGGKSYTDGGGGVIINNNIIMGIYVSALTRPYRWDLFTVLNNPSNALPRLTNNEYSTNSTITNFDVGGRFGFNIAPAKSVQATMSIKIGYSTINYLESYIDISADLENDNLEYPPILELDITHYNFNVSPQLDVQFKIGKAFKISLISGYKIQSTEINQKDLFPDIDNLLSESSLFGGSYFGIGFVFGNL